MKHRFKIYFALSFFQILFLFVTFLKRKELTSPSAEDVTRNFKDKSSHETLFNARNRIGSNVFLHKINSGTCLSHGMQSITSDEECLLAAQMHGYTVDDDHSLSIESNIGLEGCFMQHKFYSTMGLINAQFVLTLDNKFEPENHLEDKCSERISCFCMTNNYINFISGKKRDRITKVNGQYIVTWALNLGGQESLLDSAFLKAGFEQSVKDYINNDILCSDDLSVKGAEFFGVEIINDSGNENRTKKMLAISGNGLCKGDIRRCEKPVQLKKKIKNADANEIEDKTSQLVKATNGKQDFCDVFLSSTIFDAFKERLLAASGFNYDVDVGVVSDLEGNIDLKYEVNFQPKVGGGLNQIDDVGLDPDEPVAINPTCTIAQCFSQKEVMRNIFTYFDIPFDEDKHECLNQGINCDSEDLVTHIWMVNYGFSGKSIPAMIGSLPSLVGLFLGGNQLIGTLPEEIAKLRNLKLLWLENNLLTGSIPSEVGNLRALLELNLYNNQLTGKIPTQFDKLRKLEMLNIGKNQFNKQIPNFSKPKEILEEEPDCVSFANPFRKVFTAIGMKYFFLSHDDSSIDIGSLPNLKSLTISDNAFNGTIPTEFALFPSLESLDIGANAFIGTLPTELTVLSNLKVLDLHGNLITGTIPEEIWRLNKLEILNLFGNSFSGTIPLGIGRLNKLQELVLDQNDLTGALPRDVGYLTKLKYLTFGQNKMKGTIPTEIGKLVALENFDIRNYSLAVDDGDKRQTGTIPSELGLLTSWKHVIFLNNDATGTIPKEFGNISSAEALWMKNLGISGTLPTELGQLDSLSFLSFGGNKINGTLPTELGAINGLEALDFGDNELSGEIPTELGNLSSLKVLQLGTNEFSGGIPSEFGNLHSLENLHIADTNLNGDVPTELGILENLAAFQIAGNVIVGTIPIELTYLVNMKNFDCGGNGLTGTIPSELENLQNLVKINLASNNLTGTIPTEITTYDLLGELLLNENNLSGTLPTELGNLQNLVILNLKNNSFDGDIPSELGNIQTLQTIDLGSNQLTFTIPSQIADIGALEYLDISNNDMTGRIPSILEELVANDLVLFIPDNSFVITYPSTFVPSLIPSAIPSGSPSIFPTISAAPSLIPTSTPSIVPSLLPSPYPSLIPTTTPSIMPSLLPSSYPSLIPTATPSIMPSLLPSSFPTISTLGVYPPIMSSAERFGYSVCASNTVVVGGSPIKTVTTIQQGIAHMFSLTGDYLGNLTALEWSGNVTVDDATGVDRFGTTVACSDTHILVSSPYDDEVTAGTGSAYLYEIDGAFVTKVSTSLPFWGAYAGLNGLAIGDDKFIIGNERYSGSRGIAFVYNFTGSEIFTIQHNDTSASDNFGFAVDIADGFIVAGAYTKGSYGAAYIFTDTGTQMARLDPVNETFNMYFGHSVGVSNDKVVVGAPYYTGQRGAVYVYSIDGSFLLLIDGANNTVTGDRFGWSVGISDAQNKIIVGAPLHDSFGSSSGAVYIFQTDGTEIQQRYGSYANQRFGDKVAISDSKAVVGTWYDNQYLGVAAGGIWLM